MLSVRHLSVRLGARPVLSDISFDAVAGECILVLGANGAGKSTLLRALAGLVAGSGTIELDRRPLADFAPFERARRIAFLPQAGDVHWPLPAREVVAIGRLPFGSSLLRRSAADEAAIERALDLADAGALADRSVTELSGGERARVLLARALAVDAPLLIADEPVAALDPSHQLGVMTLMTTLAAEGRLVIAALHDLTLAARFASRVLVIAEGRLVADGSPGAVLDDRLLGLAFGIRALRLEHGDSRFVVPWSRDHSRR